MEIGRTQRCQETFLSHPQKRFLTRFSDPAESKREIAAAARELQRGLESCPDDTTLLRELARLLHADQKHSSALVTLERLTALLPNDTSAWHNRGVVLALLDRNDESQAAFTR